MVRMAGRWRSSPRHWLRIREDRLIPLTILVALLTFLCQQCCKRPASQRDEDIVDQCPCVRRTLCIGLFELGSNPLRRSIVGFHCTNNNVVEIHRSARAPRSPRSARITNMLPTLEHGRRRWIQERMRLIESPNEAGDEVQREQQEQDVNERSPEQHAQQTPRDAKHQAQNAPSHRCARSIDDLKILAHDKSSGGDALQRTPREYDYEARTDRSNFCAA